MSDQPVIQGDKDQHFDYIIAGGGLSGLMLAYRTSLDTYFDSKKILIIDRQAKIDNDRTWCYWEKGDGEWDHLLTKSWEKIYFGSENYKATIPLEKYRYKMVRSKKLYAFFHEAIAHKTNITSIIENITSIDDDKDGVIVTSDRTKYYAKKVFTSIFDNNQLTSQQTYAYLKQHFVGWFVEVDQPLFDDSTAVFMDFDIPQSANTRFMYVLPTSPTVALFEHTLFSEDLLSISEYEDSIKAYLNKSGIKNYRIIEKEQGNIPMTCFPFEYKNSINLMSIGSAGGWTKPSTGYTFGLTTEYSRRLISFLKSSDDLSKFSVINRYWYYDLIMLDVLQRKNVLGSEIFASIFKGNKVEEIFRFLDQKGTVWSDLKIMLNTKPMHEFSYSAIKQTKTMIGKLMNK